MGKKAQMQMFKAGMAGYFQAVCNITNPHITL